MSPAVVEALAALERVGELRPDRVVEVARDPSSPLHPYFEWDDHQAARRHRENQARALIRSIRLEVVVNERVVLIPHYIHDEDAGDAGYVSTLKIADDRAKAVRTVEAELGRVLGALERARAVAAVLGLSEAIERAVAATTAAAEELKKAA